MPFSGMQAINLKENFAKPWETHTNEGTETSTLSWYNGPTVVEAFDMIEEPTRHQDWPLKIPISRSFDLKDTGTIVMGKVEQGVLEEGQMVSLGPEGLNVKCKSLFYANKPVKKALPGTYVSFCLEPPGDLKITREYSFSGNFVLPEMEQKMAMQRCEKFTAEITIIKHKGILPSTLVG